MHKEDKVRKVRKVRKVQLGFRVRREEVDQQELKVLQDQEEELDQQVPKVLRVPQDL